MKYEIDFFLHYILTPSFRYGKAINYTFFVYTLFIIIFCFCFNFQNGKLEKKEGVIEDVIFKRFGDNTLCEYIYAFKIVGDTTSYIQVWQLDKLFLKNLFLFNSWHLPQDIALQKGNYVEFYTDVESKYYPYHFSLYFDEKTGKEKYTIMKSLGQKISVLTYGMKVNGETYLSYTKRGFVSNTYDLLMIAECLIFMVFSLMYLLHHYAAASTYFSYRELERTKKAYFENMVKMRK